MEKEELIDFESWVVETFNAGKLRSPVHLSGGNEEPVIEVFKQIKSNDWVFSTYRSHYHALLHGIDKEWLKQWILDNKSIHVMNKEHKFWTSAIVGGCLPIALGVALGIKLRSEAKKDGIDGSDKIHLETRNINGEDNRHERYADDVDNQLPSDKVYVFCGDMASQTGIFHEVFKYAVNHKLPIKFIIENNFLSTDTDTAESWGVTRDDLELFFEVQKARYPDYFDYYTYTRFWPHYGSGKFISSLWDTKDVKGKGF